jgi:hypothetical protein
VARRYASTASTRRRPELPGGHQGEHLPLARRQLAKRPAAVAPQQCGDDLRVERRAARRDPLDRAEESVTPATLTALRDRSKRGAARESRHADVATTPHRR